MTIDEATLMAYLDGELDAQGVAQVDAAMTRDAELAARIARQRRLDARLRTSHVAAAQAPVPDALLQRVLGTGVASKADASEATTAPGHVVAFAPRKRARTVWTHLGALAAGIVLAVIALPWLRGPREADWVQGSDGLRARGELAAALDDQLSVDRAGRVQVALSFRDQGGALLPRLQHGFGQDRRPGLSRWAGSVVAGPRARGGARAGTDAPGGFAAACCGARRGGCAHRRRSPGCKGRTGRAQGGLALGQRKTGRISPQPIAPTHRPGVRAPGDRSGRPCRLR